MGSSQSIPSRQYSNLVIPISIFHQNLTVLESVVKFFAQEKQLTLRQISEVLNRDEKNIWHIYERARARSLFLPITTIETERSIPVSVFAADIPALEAATLYLRDKQLLSYQKIADILQKNYKTIYTAYQRAKKKKLPVKRIIQFPIDILTDKLTVFESVVKHLHEEQEISLSKIAQILHRDKRNIWQIYANAKAKVPRRTVAKGATFWVPIHIFSAKLSPTEAVVLYLRAKKKLSFSEIARLLSKEYRTIWTIYDRARKKNAK